MAIYKYSQYISQSDNVAFDQIIEPGTAAPYPGIYRCSACGREIAIAQGHRLPAQNHHLRRPGYGRIQWQLEISHA